MGAVEVFVYTRKWVGCTQTVQPRYIKDCGAHWRGINSAEA